MLLKNDALASLVQTGLLRVLLVCAWHGNWKCLFVAFLLLVAFVISLAVLCVFVCLADWRGLFRDPGLACSGGFRGGRPAQRNHYKRI